MQSLTQIGPSEIFLITRRDKPSTRTHLWFNGKLNLRQDSLGVVRLKNRVAYSARPVPPNLIAAEKEEAKAVLTLFLKKQGLSNSVSVKIINKSDLFIDHLVSKLHSIHKSRYLVGRELTTLEIRDSLVPYLEHLHKQHGHLLSDLVISFPDPPPPAKTTTTQQQQQQQQPLSPSSQVSSSDTNKKTLKALSRVSELDDEGALRPQTLYLLDLGLTLDQIKTITRKFPAFPYYTLDGKIKPVVEFLLNLGIPKPDIPTIIIKRPQICGISLEDNLKPTMIFLETLGIDKAQWAKIIHRFPAILTYSRNKLNSTAEFLTKTGLNRSQIGKILTRCPNIMSYSVEEKLIPTKEYFESLNVDVAVLLNRCPQTFGLSVESNLKPVTEFFLEKGFGLDEIGTMVSRYGALYTFSLRENVIPKLDYFETAMEYPKTELVKFPQFFGYSLKERIIPRYELVKRSGVRLLLNQVLSLSGIEFERVVKKKMMKKQLVLSEEQCREDLF